MLESPKYEAELNNSEWKISVGYCYHTVVSHWWIQILSSLSSTSPGSLDLYLPAVWLVSPLSGFWSVSLRGLVFLESVSMSTGGLYSAPAPMERIPSGYLNQVNAETAVNGNSYVCLVPFFNRLVQSSGLMQGTGLVPGNGYLQNTNLTGNFTPVIMETTTQTPPMVSLVHSFFHCSSTIAILYPVLYCTDVVSNFALSHMESSLKTISCM